ncbi:MAG: nucleotidyltransferase domain-containing protein [Spirochaetales bacterium]|nr:nucleotidyltransferase domain-containing protein [Spirochaetales bacterium]
MRDIAREIQENLDAIEKQYDVRILWAAEAGSRAWGFPSPDSDYDVRFVYVHHPEEYLRIDAMRDVIEWKLDAVLDINGWDLQKTLLAFGKGNPNVMEWTNSPIIYKETPAWQELKPVAMGYFSEKAALCHYYGIAKATLMGYLKGSEVSYKKYLYALRPLLCCRWIETYHSVPPVEFRQMLPLLERTSFRDAVEELLKLKARSEEKEQHPQIPQILDFVTQECERQNLLAESAADDRKKDWQELNTAFRKVLGYA